MSDMNWESVVEALNAKSDKFSSKVTDEIEKGNVDSALVHGTAGLVISALARALAEGLQPPAEEG